MILTINPDNPQPRLIQKAVDALRKGAVICYPTDTVYGIGCDMFNQKAVKRIHQIKKRPAHKPFSFMCSNLKNVSDYCHISNTSYRITKKHLPGPYTFILQATKLVPKIMITKQKTVGIRVPNNPISLALIEGLGNPIVNSSAIFNPDDPPITEAYELEHRLGKQIDIIIDGGPIYPEPSSVISLTADVPEVLRAGKGDISNF